MAITLADMRRDAEAARTAAERDLADAEKAFRRLLDLCGGDDSAMSEAQSARAEGLARARREARDAITRADTQLATVAELEGEQRSDEAAQRDIRPTRAAAVLRGGDGEFRPGDEHRGATPARSEATWTREDGRPAAVERGQRMADHPVVQEMAERDPGRKITEQHSGIGQLVRSLSTTGSSAIVPIFWSSNIIDRARNAAQVIAAGAESIPMDSKQLNIGRLTTDPTAAWLAEGGTRTASDPVFDSVSLVAKTLTCLTVASLEFLQDAINADSVVEEAIGKAMGLAIDYAALFGGVTAGGEGINQPSPPSPQGILANLLANATSSVLGSGANGTNITAATPWNELLTTYFTPRGFNEQPTAILLNTKMAQKYAMTYDTLGQPLRPPPVLDNIPILQTNQIPSFTQGTLTTATDIFCGDFRQVLIGNRMDLTVTALTERYAELGQVGILATFRGDIALARARSMAVYRYLQGA